MLGLPLIVKGVANYDVVLKPFTKEDAISMAPYFTEKTSRYLSRHGGQTEDTEVAWYESTLKDNKLVNWGIFVKDGEELVFSGTTSLDQRQGFPLSGVLIHRHEYWGNGVVSAAHLARTRYAVEVLDLSYIRSEVFQGNHASRKALEKLGYVKVGTEYGKGFIQGQPQHADQYLWVNPSDRAWDHFWGDTKPPSKLIKAREVSQQALEYARQVVEYL